MQERIELIGQLGSVALTPDAVLVLQMPGSISQEQESSLREAVGKAFPGRKCIVLQEGMTAGVIQPTTTDRLESIEAKLASMASTLLALADALTESEEDVELRPGLDGDPPARERDQSQIL